MCCLYGMIDYGAELNMKRKNKILSVLSKECEERGTHATGIAYNWGGNLRIIKKGLPAHQAKLTPMGSPTVIMGHTRFTTKGSEKDNYNNHPFMGHFSDSRFALAHNGVLYNDEWLRKSEKLPDTKIKTDSYIHDLRHSHASLLLELGLNQLLISQRLGHENIETTMNIYAHLYPDRHEQVADILEKIAGKTENEDTNIDI